MVKPVKMWAVISGDKIIEDFDGVLLYKTKELAKLNKCFEFEKIVRVEIREI